MIWFTADLHLGHTGILTHNDRKVSCIEEMDTTIIDCINDCVGRNDILWHLGDFCWRASEAGHYRQRLKVRQLHSIRGNHDASSLHKHCSTLSMLAMKKFDGRSFTLCH
jgi:calcineurin-like phosphoesterase family protein